MEQRNQQVGLLLALGWGRSLIKFITYAEVAVVSLLGSLIGVGFAWFFGQGVLWMLGEPWGGAVAGLIFLIFLKALQYYLVYARSH